MWALSAQLSLAQSAKTINPDVFLPTCADEFTSEHEFNERLSQFFFSDVFLCIIFLFKTTATITNEE